MIAGILGASAVGLGAIGAHALADLLPPGDLETYRLAARYQLVHAVALLAVAALARGARGRLLPAAGWLLTTGTVIFSGSLYFLVLTGPRALGAVTPLGGVCLIAGWLCLAAAGLRNGRSRL